MRIQVTTVPDIGDGRAHALAARLKTIGLETGACRVADVYLVSGIPGLTPELARELFCDAVAQTAFIDGDDAPPPWDLLVEVGYRPGVADPVASSIRDALGSELGGLPPGAIVQTARQYLFQTDADHESIARELYNPLIQHALLLTRTEWAAGARTPAIYPVVVAADSPPVERIDVGSMTDAELERCSTNRLLALTLAEMQAIRDYFTGSNRPATDVELEMIAQTWSEHCKHKIFAAKVEYRERNGAIEVIDGLFRTYIKATTERVGRPDFVKSVFDDNAGVVRFDDETLICLKAETHNSPSALDPYGGAITGIVGVNRDILGTGKGARPIFNTDVLCFGYPDTPAESLPEGLLHPRVVMDGVHRGIVDGGNQSGIPTAAGAFLFDESYTGKPLVFCGTGGILPAQIDGEDAWIKHIDAGDAAVMVGGLIGKDGIHGATFSSLVLDESSPTSAVQIGEPITQKKMADFLLEARDRGLYKGITDNGAGGLSSSFGEMARDSGGVRLDLDRCPLKYEGLAAWEILVSESQERMSLAVDPARLDAFLALARERGVEANAIGEFTDSGRVEATHRGELVVSIGLDFLHDGLPQMVIPAHWTGPRGAWGAESAVRPTAASPADDAVGIHDRLLGLLRDPNIGSKEHLVRQYDHEVQAGSVVKPQCGVHADAPSDGAVIRPRLDSWRGITVTHGICPRRGDDDTYEMALAAVDEAVRAHVALGGDPEQMAALDNFCWPDPVLSESTPDGPYKMAQLVRACRGLADSCIAYGLPLISGKDSMKNDARLGGRKVSIRPTLLVSLMGIVPDVRLALTTDFREPGDRILLVGDTDVPADTVAGERSRASLDRRFSLYKRLHRAVTGGLARSIHDVSDGGVAVALAECAIGGRLGVRVDLPDHEALFAEPLGSFVVSCAPAASSELAAILGDSPWTEIGEVSSDPELIVGIGGSDAARAGRAAPAARTTLRWSLDALVDAWKSFGRRQGESMEPRTVCGAGRRGAGDARAADAPLAAVPSAAAAATVAAPVTATAPRALILTGYGINADRELGAAFALAGASVEPIHVNDLLRDPSRLDRASILGVPGGFSYGDHVGSGIMLAHRLRALRGQLDRFRREDGLILGICNGFQVLVKLGILPDLAGEWRQEVSLVHNDCGIFEDSWVTVEFSRGSSSPWLSGLSRLDVPIRHGEGRFVTRDPAVLAALHDRGLVAATYSGRNPNGSQDAIAAIVDTTGNVLGMMPHPEAYLVAPNHPHWRTRGVPSDGGLQIFRNAVSRGRSVG